MCVWKNMQPTFLTYTFRLKKTMKKSDRLKKGKSKLIIFIVIVMRYHHSDYHYYILRLPLLYIETTITACILRLPLLYTETTITVY